MPVEYDFYRTPNPDKSEEEKYHARVVNKRTIDSERLAKNIQEGCTLTETDVRAVLSALTHSLIRQLSYGNRVHIEGFGFFEMTLQCPPIKNTKKIRAESIKFKSISFRPEKKLKIALSAVRFERAAIKKHSNEYSEEEFERKLTEYFSDHEYFMRRDIERIYGFTRWMAGKKINQLLAEGKIVKEGLKNAPFYKAAKGHFNVNSM